MDYGELVLKIQDIKEEFVQWYFHLVTRRVPGPRSISWLASFVLLPLALMIPPERLSHTTLVSVFLPLILACSVHGMLFMEASDVLGVDMVLLSFQMLWWQDVRKDYKRIWHVEKGQVTKDNKLSKATEVVGGGRNTKVVESNGSLTNAKHHESSEKTPATNDTAIEEESYPKDLIPRLRWIGTLMASTRLGCWAIGSSSHDARVKKLRSHPTRLEYVRSALPHLPLHLFCLSTSTLMSRYDPYFLNAGTISIFSPYQSPSSFPLQNEAVKRKPLLITALQILPPPILRPLTIAAFCYSAIFLQHSLLSPIAVTMNYIFGIPPDNWSIHTVEPLFGPFTSVLDNGIRGLWGTWWHQQIRVIACAPAKALIRKLNIKETSTKSYAMQTVSAFFFSGVTHMGLVPAYPYYAVTASPLQLRLLVGGFFWAQPIAIGMEMVIIGADDKENKKRIARLSWSKLVLRRIAMLTWVLSWLILTLPLLAVPFAELGWWLMLPAGFPFQWFVS